MKSELNILLILLVAFCTVTSAATSSSSDSSAIKVITCKDDTLSWDRYCRKESIWQTDTSDWNSYVDTTYRIQFQYPPYIKVVWTDLDSAKNIYTISFDLLDTANSYNRKIWEPGLQALLVSFVKMNFEMAIREAPSFGDFPSVTNTAETFARGREFLPEDDRWSTWGIGGDECPDDILAPTWRARCGSVSWRQFAEAPEEDEPSSWLASKMACFAWVPLSSGYSVAFALNSEKVSVSDFFMSVRSLKELKQ
jgi:hypothetical protein